jgi:hypothetical protein
VGRLLEMQVTDPASRWRGTYPDDTGLHQPHGAGGILATCSASFLHPESRHHKSGLLLERMRLAAAHLDQAQTPDGNVDLLITNFNSPPDVAFVTWGVASAALVARRHGERELAALSEKFLRRAGAGMARGGIHTPNHRWVLCSALEQIHELYPDPGFVRRIDEWLAEGIDLDEDGQYSERSTTVYNGHCDRAFVILAAKLHRPELLEPVRRNLDAMMYLLHPDGEVVTEISQRQDQNTRGTMATYWMALRYLANRDGNGIYQTMARQLEPAHASLLTLMEYPELLEAGPRPEPVPASYERHFKAGDFVRIRRGELSATILGRGYSRFFSARKGQAVVEAVRFASAFFGKGQFVPAAIARAGDAWRLTQSLDAGYYQPLPSGQKQPWGVEAWYDRRDERRRRTEISKIDYAATIREQSGGFDVRVEAQGTRDVPLAVEVNLRPGGELEGCSPVPGVADGWVLGGDKAVYRAGADAVEFGPGSQANLYTQVRGAHPKLPGPSVYLTGYTPFDHTIRFRFR